MFISNDIIYRNNQGHLLFVCSLPALCFIAFLGNLVVNSLCLVLPPGQDHQEVDGKATKQQQPLDSRSAESQETPKNHFLADARAIPFG